MVFYYNRLITSTLAKDSNDEKNFGNIELRIPLELRIRNVESEGGFIFQYENTLKKRFVWLCFFMAHTALYRLKDVEKMFEIATYSITMKLNFSGMEQFPGYFEKLIENHFIEVEKKNRIERLEFLIQEGILEDRKVRDDDDDEEEEEEGEYEEEELSSVVNIKWKNCDQNIFIKKYFLSRVFEMELKEDDKISLSEKVSLIDPTIIYKCLYGFNLSENEIFQNIFSLFHFFEELHLYGHMYTLCRSVNQISLEKKMMLFNRCIKNFEEKISNNNQHQHHQQQQQQNIVSERVEELIDGKLSDDDIDSFFIDELVSFNSPITLSVFNSLRLERENIKKIDRFVLVLGHLGGYYQKLKRTKEKKLRDHSFFKLRLDDIRNMVFIDDHFTFEDYFERILLIRIYRSNLHASHILTTANDDASFLVHKEIITLRSNFFYQMFKFPGRESNSRNILIEDSLSCNSLKMLLDSIYFNDFYSISDMSDSSSSNLKSLFELLIHSEMYHNKLMESRIIKTIDEVFVEFSKKNQLILKILENGKYIDKMPYWYRELMVKRWEGLSKLCSGEFNAIIDHSIETERLAMEEENDDDEENTVIKRKNRDEDDNDENNNQPIRKKRKKEDN